MLKIETDPQIVHDPHGQSLYYQAVAEKRQFYWIPHSNCLNVYLIK